MKCHGLSEGMKVRFLRQIHGPASFPRHGRGNCPAQKIDSRIQDGERTAEPSVRATRMSSRCGVAWRDLRNRGCISSHCARTSRTVAPRPTAVSVSRDATPLHVEDPASSRFPRRGPALRARIASQSIGVDGMESILSACASSIPVVDLRLMWPIPTT